MVALHLESILTRLLLNEAGVVQAYAMKVAVVDDDCSSSCCCSSSSS